MLSRLLCLALKTCRSGFKRNCGQNIARSNKRLTRPQVNLVRVWKQMLSRLIARSNNRLTRPRDNLVRIWEQMLSRLISLALKTCWSGFKRNCGKTEARSNQRLTPWSSNKIAGIRYVGWANSRSSYLPWIVTTLCLKALAEKECPVCRLRVVFPVISATY